MILYEANDYALSLQNFRIKYSAGVPHLQVQYRVVDDEIIGYEIACRFYGANGWYDSFYFIWRADLSRYVKMA